MILPSLILLLLPLCAFVPLCEILRIDEQHARIDDSLGEAMSLHQIAGYEPRPSTSSTLTPCWKTQENKGGEGEHLWGERE
jgi:hypothetical protein